MTPDVAVVAEAIPPSGCDGDVAYGLRILQGFVVGGISITKTLIVSLMMMFWTQMETSLGAIARVKGFEEGTMSENLPGEKDTPAENWPSEGAIEFRDISASYGYVKLPFVAAKNADD